MNAKISKIKTLTVKRIPRHPLWERLRSTGKRLFLAAGLFTASAWTLCAAVSINGTCQQGSCNSPSVITEGNTLTETFDVIYVFPNTDKYRVFGSLTLTNNVNGSSWITFSCQANYLGNTTDGISGLDKLTIDGLVNVATESPNGYFSEATSFFFAEPISPPSTAEDRIILGGYDMTLMGPASPPGPDTFNYTNTITGLTSPVLNDVQDTFTFAAGSKPGAAIGDQPIGPLPPGEPNCGATDVTSVVALSQEAFVGLPPNFADFTRRIKLTNGSQAITEPIYLVFDGLPQTNTFICPAPNACVVAGFIAVTHCQSPSPNGGSIYGPIAGDLAAGQTLQINPAFLPAEPYLSTAYALFPYTLRVFAGQPQ